MSDSSIFQFRYPNKFFRCLLIIWIIALLCEITFLFVFLYSVSLGLIISGIYQILYICQCLLLLQLYLTKLNLLTKLHTFSSNQYNRIINIMVKYTVLTLLATFAGLIVGTFSIIRFFESTHQLYYLESQFIIFDCLLNIVAIFFQYSFNAVTYYRVFGCLDDCVRHCLSCCCLETEEERKQSQSIRTLSRLSKIAIGGTRESGKIHKPQRPSNINVVMNIHASNNSTTITTATTTATSTNASSIVTSKDLELTNTNEIGGVGIGIGNGNGNGHGSHSPVSPQTPDPSSPATPNTPENIVIDGRGKHGRKHTRHSTMNSGFGMRMNVGRGNRNSRKVSRNTSRQSETITGSVTSGMTNVTPKYQYTHISEFDASYGYEDSEPLRHLQ